MAESHTTATAFPAVLQQLISEIRANPRLQAGIVTLTCIILSWLLFFNDDIRKEYAAKLEKQHTLNNQMHAQLGSPSRQANLQLLLEKTQAQIEAMLWHFPAPVIAQTEFSDWLKNILKDSGVSDTVITQPSFSSMDQSKKSEKDTTALQPACEDGLCNLIEIRANVRFRFEPTSLAKVLYALESSEPLVRIDQASFNTQSHLAEISVITHAKITPPPQQTAISEKPHAIRASEASTTAAIGASTPESKKVVEIKW